MSWQMHFLRNTSKDVIPQPAILYTDSTTLTTGMTLYDNTGTDTGLNLLLLTFNTSACFIFKATKSLLNIPSALLLFSLHNKFLK